MSDARGDHRRVALNHRPTFTLIVWRKELSGLAESCEAPVALLCIKSVGCNMVQINARVVLIPEDQAELYASIPVLWRLIAMAVLEVEGGMIEYVVTVWEEEDLPVFMSADVPIYPFSSHAHSPLLLKQSCFLQPRLRRSISKTFLHPKLLAHYLQILLLRHATPVASSTFRLSSHTRGCHQR